MKPASASCTLRVRNAVDAIGPATEKARVWLGEHHASEDATYLASLAIEELVTNCVKYGYEDGAEHAIDVRLAMDDAMLSIEVIDDGRAFNPLDAPPPDLSLAMEDRPIGGLGIHLLRELADDMKYERRNGTNRLVLTKRIA